MRPFHATSRIYHHTPVVEGFEPHGWGVIELAAQDRSRALAPFASATRPSQRICCDFAGWIWAGATGSPSTIAATASSWMASRLPVWACWFGLRVR